MLQLTPNVHEVYGEQVCANNPAELQVLYKLLPGGRFPMAVVLIDLDTQVGAN